MTRVIPYAELCSALFQDLPEFTFPPDICCHQIQLGSSETIDRAERIVAGIKLSDENLAGSRRSSISTPDGRVKLW